MIAQLFALKGEGGQRWVTKQLGPGTCWQELAWPVLWWGLPGVGAEGPCTGAGEPAGFLLSAFQPWEWQGGEGGSRYTAPLLHFPSLILSK